MNNEVRTNPCCPTGIPYILFSFQFDYRNLLICVILLFNHRLILCLIPNLVCCAPTRSGILTKINCMLIHFLVATYLGALVFTIFQFCVHCARMCFHCEWDELLRYRSYHNILLWLRVRLILARTLRVTIISPATFLFKNHFVSKLRGISRNLGKYFDRTATCTYFRVSGACLCFTLFQ